MAERPSHSGSTQPDRLWMLAMAGFAAFHISLIYSNRPQGLWFPAVGIGLAVVAWVGHWMVPFLAADFFFLKMVSGGVAEEGLVKVLGDALILGGEISLYWWLYHHWARGTRRLEDPRSATLFLILVPGTMGAFWAGMQFLFWDLTIGHASGTIASLESLWIGRLLGLLVLVPPLLVVATPGLEKYRLAFIEPEDRQPGGRGLQDWTWGEAIEIVGLGIGTAILAMVLVWMHLRVGVIRWPLWGGSLLLVIWASLRQGLRGGVLVASSGAIFGLVLASAQSASPGVFSPLQANLLGQCCTALLVGASAGWIRASEARYRQIVGQIPVVLYSVRLPRPVSGNQHGATNPVPSPRNLAQQAEITLVSPASRIILNLKPEELLGSYWCWLEKIFPEDRELVLASLAQLCLQKQPVVCEYRLEVEASRNEEGSHQASPPRWIRETLAPYHNGSGLLQGWEGVVEDITEQRVLSHELRRTSNMLQALVAHMPMGVFFVQEPLGKPILVNARARQLLGRRENATAGLEQLTEIYDLRRPDGSPYPAEELPVSKALRQGETTMAKDIVVHKPDGRRLPLISWAAPVNLHGQDKSDAAVWVLEDWSAVQEAESARRESEARLGAVVESMAEGLIVANQAGLVIDCNQAACSILAIPRQELLGKPFLDRGLAAIQENGASFPAEDLPDRFVLKTGQPVRNLLLGLQTPGEGESRWLLVNALPLGTGTGVVLTFIDITAHRQAQQTMQAAKEKYQSLVENLPMMVLQFNREGQITFFNPAIHKISGYGPEELAQTGFWQKKIHAEDLPRWQTSLNRTLAGYHARTEFRFQAKDGAAKVGLALMQPQGSKGNISGSTCLVLDMTVQRQLEEELQKSQRLELVGRLASGTVHDFNNLLAIMLGLADLARSNLPEDHQAVADLRRLVEVGEQASHLAGQLLAFSKQWRRPPHPVDLNGVINQTLKWLRRILPNNLEIETNLAAEKPLALAEENQLKQILMNLCLNAKDAMPQGGKIAIRTWAGGKNEVPFAVPDPGNWHGLAVEDNGQGMEDSVQARIFEPFFTTKSRGTGLGLAVVRQIVESFSGRIHVWSKPNQGTRMEIWLRKVQAPAALSEPKSLVPAAAVV